MIRPKRVQTLLPSSYKRKKSKVTTPLLLPEIWCLVFEFGRPQVRAMKFFLTIYTLNKEIHQYNGWKQVFNNTYFNIHRGTVSIRNCDHSYVSNLTLNDVDKNLLDDYEAWKTFKHVTNLKIEKCPFIRNVHLAYFKNLEYMSIISCLGISNDAINTKKRLKALELLCQPKITNSAFRKLQELRSLRVSVCAGIDTDLFTILQDRLKELKWFQFDQLQDEDLKKISNCESLLISSSKITGKGFEYIKNLKHLDISSCENIEDSVFKYLEKVETMNISKCIKLTGSGFKYLSKVRILECKQCSLITDDKLLYLKSIRSLSIGFCSLITDQGLKNLKGSSIEELEIADCDLITEKGILELPNLQVLELDPDRNITLELLKGLPNLRMLIGNLAYVRMTMDQNTNTRILIPRDPLLNRAVMEEMNRRNIQFFEWEYN